jgi:hypothetical protein
MERFGVAGGAGLSVGKHGASLSWVCSEFKFGENYFDELGRDSF